MKKVDFKYKLNLLTKHIIRHRVLMVIASSIISLIALLFVIFWEFDEANISTSVDYFYLVGNIIFLAISVLLTAFLIISRFIKFKTFFLAILIHCYVFLLISWGTAVCVFDLRYGFSPIFYLMLLTLVAGLFVVEPLFFCALTFTSACLAFGFSFKGDISFFSGSSGVENIITFVIYIVVILLIGVEHFGVTITNYRNEQKLEHLTYFDDLTGLLNERSYLKEIEDIDKQVEENKLNEYAVILMDLNNIKATNDTYGHRYGCHLIVRCGHILPDYFESSSLFHIGGDEFVAIVYGKDYQNLDAILEIFDNKLSFSKIEYEGHELIFSLAHGFAKYEKGLKYKDVLQKADDSMYINKKMIKEKYGMKQR